MEDFKNVNILPEFLEAFCIRVDQIPQVDITGDVLDYTFIRTKTQKDNMTYNAHEGYLNFTFNNVTYLTRDCEDVRTYLKSLGFKESQTYERTVLAAWYLVDDLLFVYHPSSMIFRKFFALSLLDNFSPTFVNGTIGKNEEEIKKNIEILKQEVLFDDDKWLHSDWGKSLQIERDQLFFRKEVKYMEKCISSFEYENVFVDKDMDPKSREEIINYWLHTSRFEGHFELTEPYIESIKETATKKPFIISDQVNDRLLLLAGLRVLCKSEEELMARLQELDKEVLANRL